MELVHLLMEEGVDLTQKNYHNHGPNDLAKKYGHHVLARRFSDSHDTPYHRFN